MMLAEALTLPGWSPGKVKKRLRLQPVALQSLTRFRPAVETILQSRITVLTIAPVLLGTAAILSQQFGLLTNDALTVAADAAANPAFLNNWMIVQDWKETSRYQTTSHHLAKKLYNAIVNTPNGVMPWIRGRW
ncbi:MAG: hypothetical protein ACRELG_04470 [Gemmataceae bacterium]